MKIIDQLLETGVLNTFFDFRSSLSSSSVLFRPANVFISKIFLISPQVDMLYGSGDNRSDGTAYVHHIRGVVCVGECGHARDEFGGEMDTTARYHRRRCVCGRLDFLCGRFRRHVDVPGAKISQCKRHAAKPTSLLSSGGICWVMS